MTLGALVGALAVAAETACHQARAAYGSNIEALAAGKAALPGAPSRLTVVSLGTLVPRKLRLDATVSVRVVDGDLEVEFAPSGRHWWNRPPPALANLAIEWRAGEVPEAVCRIRDRQNAALDVALRGGSDG